MDSGWVALTQRQGGFTWPPNPDSPQAPMSPGLTIRFRCMGCNRDRLAGGSKGKGVLKRCAECLAAREAKRGTR